MKSENHVALPLEIERCIFETAVRSRRKDLFQYLLVSRYVHTWLERLLFETIVIECSGDVHNLPRYLERLPLISKYTKSLCFYSTPTYDLATNSGWHQLVNSLNALENLAFWPSFSQTSVGPVLELMKRLPLRRLSVDLSLIFADLTPTEGRLSPFESMFSNMTHLQCTHSWQAPWDGFRHLPRLTHLAFIHHPSTLSNYQDRLREILATCPRLKVLAYAVYEEYERTELVKALQNIVDPRFTVVVNDGEIDDWKLGATGGADFWVRAERLVLQALEKEKARLAQEAQVMDIRKMLSPPSRVDF